MANLTISPITLTTSWQNVGSKINLDGVYRIFSVFPTITVNNSTGIRFRLLVDIDKQTGYPLTYRQSQYNEQSKFKILELLAGELVNSKTILPFSLTDNIDNIQLQVKTDVVGATAGTIDRVEYLLSYETPGTFGDKLTQSLSFANVISSEVDDSVSTNTTTSVKILDSNTDRKFVSVVNNSEADIWIKLQAAAADDDKKGIILYAGCYWEMPQTNMYTGEISAISDDIVGVVYVTEY